ncbi:MULTISPECIES: hypothetical protein [Bacillus]|uniref:hypothetical protein n=1 Tax=Bacillus TaxID=1386 RepID=UPI000814BB38|nr:MULTISPECIES: hypothetical protein [Bacillus]MDU0069721.1 hypothetical protein [Bacillus sp. IG6]MED8018006.1 hypothetical protein [Bacillus glycinifermentans]WKB79422.1 hypothetical protein QYM22_11490 [Bacillus glycinifermentans]SCA86027.1 DNA polymerase III, delta subunit [Bacillus glycinifermentans]
MDYRRETTEGEHERVSIYSSDGAECYELSEYVEDILDDKYNMYTEEMLEELRELYDLDDESEMLEWIAPNVNDETFPIFEIEESFIVPNTIFLTKKEAKEHIKRNRHHYTKKVHTYAMTAWRAPKVERLMKILETFDWDSVKDLRD